MSCKQTELLVSDFFDEAVPHSQRMLHENHLQECAECQQALASAQAVNTHLLQWREQAAPTWNRRTAFIENEKAGPKRQRIFSWWQWVPLAASLVLTMAVLFNMQIRSTEDGFVVVFGSQTQMSRADIQQQLAQFEEQQRVSQAQEIATFTARLEERQDSNNTRLMAAVMTGVVDRVVEQFEESNSRGLQQVMAYVDGQRQQDLQTLQSSYQQLADSDYQTIRSVQQLASYVQYQAE